MKRVLECGDVELSNNLSEQMMRRIKMNLKNAGNIGSEESAKHNAFHVFYNRELQDDEVECGVTI